ncbi:hypothetical protein [Rhodanobacter lindaniclasticus]
MDKKLFAELVESMTEAGEIARGERAPSREFQVGESEPQNIRKTLARCGEGSISP